MFHSAAQHVWDFPQVAMMMGREAADAIHKLIGNRSTVAQLAPNLQGHARAAKQQTSRSQTLELTCDGSRRGVGGFLQLSSYRQRR
jgi:hypothetical protein